jgi:hydroxypyruvate reductase
MTISEMKTTIRALFDKGVRAADPADAVIKSLTKTPLQPVLLGRLIILAFGKAAIPMMKQALTHVPLGQTVQAIAVTNDENMRNVAGCEVFAAGHPLPDARGLAAGQRVMDLLQTTTDADHVLCLISGGGSALLPAPREGLNLADKIAVNTALLAGGFDITQMNAIRQQLSQLKGGGLLGLAHPASVRSLIISDVIGDDIRVIASGPTATALGDPQDSIALLKSSGVWQNIPEAAQHLLATPKPAPHHQAVNEIICSNLQSLQAIADAAPEWSPQIVSDRLCGDVQDAARHIVDCAHNTPLTGKQLLIWGGETTVQIKGTGLGGRNQELAARISTLASELDGRWVFLSGGTDGRDGPTDAAGGVVCAQTARQAAAQNVDVQAALQNNDSNRILAAANDLLITGGTGTNVADIQMLLRMP